MDWDARYLAGDTPWDKGVESPVISEILERITFGKEIWLPGVGLGHDARYIAQQLPQSKVTGIDISNTVIEQARALSIPPNLRFQKADIFDLRTKERCDTWFEHTCYCAINPELRGAYRNAALHNLSPGGILAGIFFASGGKDPQEGPPFFSTEEEILDRFSEEFTLIDKWMPKSNYAGREGLETVFIFQRQ